MCNVESLENNVKRQYATVSHEFEWKSLYSDKLFAVNEFLSNAKKWEATARSFPNELAVMVPTLLI